MLEAASQFLLSRVPAERLKPFGFWLLIGSLSIDAIVLAFVPSGSTDKILSAICTVGIILGIWFEEIADHQLTGGRQISDEQAAEIIKKLAPFAGTVFAIKADPAAEYGFINRVIEVLGQAGWKWGKYSTSLITLPFGETGRLPKSLSGVQVRINVKRHDDLNEPAKALAFALTNAMRASVGLVVDPEDSPLSAGDAVYVEIRRKL